MVSWRNPISVSAVSNTLTPGLEEREARRVRTFHGTVGVDKPRVCSRGMEISTKDTASEVLKRSKEKNNDESSC